MKVRIFDNISPTLLGPGFIAVDDNPELILIRSSKLHDPTSVPESVFGIFRAGTGVDNIPIKAMTDRGIPVFNTPGANANAVKELALGMMLMSSRNCFPAVKFVEDSTPETNFEKSKKAFSGFEIAGKNILIIGLGNIGYSLAEACHCLGMNVFSYNRSVKTGPRWLYQIESLDSPAVSTCDFISLHIPNNSQTSGLIGKEFIARLKTGVTILNLAREKLIDLDALCEALDSGKVRFYACDFVQEKLKKYPPSRVVMLPHLGASTSESEARAVQRTSDQAEAYWQYGDIVNSVNFPSITTDHSLNFGRILVAVKNTPESANRIISFLQSKKVFEFNFAWNDEIDYFIIRIKQSGADDKNQISVLMKELGRLPNVLKIRLIKPPTA